MNSTLLAKLLAGLVLLALAGITGWRFGPHDGGTIQPPQPVPPSPAVQEPPPPPPKRATFVIGVNDFGGAFPAVVANDGMTAGPSSLFKAAGLDVEIRLIRDPVKRLSAFDAGDVDVVLVTLDYLANLVPTYRARNVDLRAFLMADWSRGTLGIVATPQITSIEQLGGARIATTQNTPSHYFLLTLLAKSNLKPPQVDEVKRGIVFVPETRKAGEKFSLGEVQAAAIWEPYLSQAIAGGKGHILMSTKQATNLVPDVLFSRADFLTQHAAEMVAFTRVWLQGVDMLGKDPDRWLPVLAGAFKQSPGQSRDLLQKTKLARFADDREFFGLDKKAAPYLALFDDASRVWQGAGVIRAPADAGSTRWLDALDALAGEHASEPLVEQPVFSPTAPLPPGSNPPLSKVVRVYFDTGSYRLGPGAKQELDRFVETLQQLASMYVTVAGNTDSVGNAASHAALSTARAQAVVEYLVVRHHLDRARFRVVGNGMDTRGDNTTVEGREENRRVDFRLYEAR
jgi:outer membrane protein OmpA-like peptidoglycan-associated protein/ABC-type taurine transport system substrate-binding protein